MNRHMVIVGAQGSGKTELARRLAKDKGGRMVEVELAELEKQLTSLLAAELATVIVDGFPPSAAVRKKIDGPAILLNQKYCEPRMLKTPNFIFCACGEQPLAAEALDRRFFVVRL